MKYQYFIFLILLLGVSACKPDPKNEEEMPVIDNTDFVASPVKPDLSSNTVQLLLATFWVAEVWVNHADNSQNKPNKGRWWRFKDDGTFITGQWDQTLSHGVWVLYPDQDKVLLYLDAASADLNMEFEVQQISQSGDYMSWVGTPTFKMSRIAVKAISLLTIPTKEQFGITD